MSPTPLRPVDELFVPVVKRVIGELETTPADAAVMLLALQYAGRIDNALDRTEALETFGPKLLTVLTALGASPAARAALSKGGGAANVGRGKLHAIREARRA